MCPAALLQLHLQHHHAVAVPVPAARMELMSSSFLQEKCHKQYHLQFNSFPRPMPTNVVNIMSLTKRNEGPLQKKVHKVCKCFSTQFNKSSFIEGSSMAKVYDALAQRLLSVPSLNRSDEKYIIGLAGPPGAGKSTVAAEVVARINNLWRQKAYGMETLLEPADIAISVPMDGFHLYCSELDKMEDPREAHARRGAPWTFNPSRLLLYLTNLRRQGFVYMPSFDHGVGDPVEDDIFVSPLHKIVIVEGNYLLLEDDIWKEIASIFDERWYLDVDMDIAMERVKKRHVLTGKTHEYAIWRVEYNDRRNAELIEKTKKSADLVIRSVEDSS